MSEVYLGTELDRKYIAEYLANIRRLDPIEITTLPNPISLIDTDSLKKIVDVNRFWEIVNKFLIDFEQQYSVKITPIKSERYYTALSSDSDSIGGFHDPKSFGYQYWYQASFVVLLSGEFVLQGLRTIELARNFLHDCLHHSTFRSFRRAMRVPAKSPICAKHRVPEIYREQYGINFRNQDGLSYSSTELTACSPKTINLNLLMDGVIVLVTANLLKSIVGDIKCGNYIEKEIANEIFLEPFNEAVFQVPHRFNISVTKPSQKFVEYWGSENLMPLLLRSMVSGDLVDLKRFFDSRAGIENAWERLFKRPEFSLGSKI